MNVTWKGIDPAIREMRKMRQASPRDLARAMFLEAETIMTRSKNHFVPVDTGVLRGSGHVRPPEISGGRITVVLGYGGQASAYALVQHERTDYHHTVGQAKYLEQPVNEAAAGLASRLARRIG